jgi:hypothetical protein
MEDRELYERAKQRVEARIGFYKHLAVYVVVNVLLIIINLSTTPGRYWFKWPLLGWGIGLALHAVSVFIFSRGSAMKDRMIQEEMEKESKRK